MKCYHCDRESPRRDCVERNTGEPFICEKCREADWLPLPTADELKAGVATTFSATTDTVVVPSSYGGSGGVLVCPEKPSVPEVGQTVYDTINGCIYRWNGSEWHAVELVPREPWRGRS